MIIKKIFSPTTSIISLFIFVILFNSNSNSDENNIKYYSNDEGILSIMYHRFNETKYPSKNIQMDVFKDQIEIIKIKPTDQTLLMLTTFFDEIMKNKKSDFNFEEDLLKQAKNLEAIRLSNKNKKFIYLDEID